MFGNESIADPMTSSISCPICSRLQVEYWGNGKDIGNENIQHAIWRCSYCRHLWISSPPKTLETGAAYSVQDKSFFPDAAYFEKRSQSPPTDGEVWVFDHLKHRNGTPGSLLDIGPGRPALLKKLQEKGWSVAAVEPARHAELLEEEVGCTVYHALFEDIAFPKRFDIIMALDVLEHSSDPIKFLQHICSSLTDDGVALFRFPNSVSLRCWIEHDNWEMIRPLGHLNYFSPISFDLACTKLGLEVNYWASRDVSRYTDIRLPRLLASSTRNLRVLVDALGLGDQILACVSREKQAGSRHSKWSIYQRLKPWRPPRDAVVELWSFR